MTRRSSTASPSILVLAGEPSGDAHAAAVMRAYTRRHPSTGWSGMGGPAMADAGAELIATLDRLAVMGFAEVVPRLPYFLRLRRRVERILEEDRPDAVLLVDYPGFNLRIAESAHRRGIPVVYYIAPQVWAWKKGRAARLSQTADRIAVILPFEVEHFTEHGGRATYVGHPLLDRDDHVDSREAFLDRWGLDVDRRILALLPGSRGQEIDRHLTLFAEAAQRVIDRRPDVLPVFSRAPSVSAIPFHATGFPVVEDTWALQRHACAALVKSGTGTLETALEGTPLVVAYRTSGLTAAIGRRVVDVEHIGLPNLVAGRRIVPEFIQEDATPESLADAVIPLLEDGSTARSTQIEELAGVRGGLGARGAADRVADLLDEVVAS
ncbi:MAG: lipid-A-disaccharide synthase [Gemmatimonadota bacterium]